MLAGTETDRPRRPRAERSALSAGILSLLAVLSLLLLAGLPATADAETRPGRPCAAAQVKDPACPSQRFALQVAFDADEPALSTRTLALRPAGAVLPRPGAGFVPAADAAPATTATCPPERPPRSA